MPYPRQKYSLLPVPLHRLTRISEDLKANIYCLRDDLTGFAFGGNKTRKLDYLIADAIKQNCDTIIATGSVQSNFCRLAAAAATAKNLVTHLVLWGDEPEEDTANLKLNKLFKARIQYSDAADYETFEKEAQQLYEELTSLGRKVYLMPLGGSTPIGILGYVRALDEIISYSVKNEIFFDTVIHACGTGGTQAGLLVGKILKEWTRKIVGICVYENAEATKERIEKLIAKTTKMLNIENSDVEIDLDDNYLGDGYGAITDKSLAAAKYFARREGITLGTTYTGKAAAAVIDYIKKGKIERTSNVLFIHTGGNLQMFE